MKLIQKGEITSLTVLARQLNVSEALVEQMLEELVRLGYLRPLETCSSETCTGCSQRKSCITLRPAQTWAVIKEIAK